MLKTFTASMVAFLCLVGDLLGQQERPTDALLTREMIAAPLRFLSHDLLEGRGVASRGDELARLYIATQLESWGYQPGAGSDFVVAASGAQADLGYVQPVPIIGITSVIDAGLTANGPNGKLEFAAPSDYTGYAWQPKAVTSWSDAELVFVGYGITAPEQKWDDFKDVDVKGKVLVVMNNDPSSDPALFAGKTRLYYGRWSYKYEEASRRGALGAIIIHTEPSAGYPFQVIQSKHGTEYFWLPFEKDESLQIAAWMADDAVKRMVQLAGHDLDALRAKAESRDFRPVPLGIKATLGLKNAVRELRSGNVVAQMTGSDPKLKDEYVVVTAHHDHLGLGPKKNNDAIYNGALDNASGCSMMLALARAMTTPTLRPKRSIIFASVTGEESGLLGSDYFARHPTVPVKQIVANLNIDGINIWGRTKDLQLVGYGKSSLAKVAAEVAAARGRTVVPDSEPEKGLFYRSDHFSLAKVGIPSVYFKAGQDFLEDADVKRRVQLAYTATHYHQPSDEFDRRWRLDGAVEDARLMLDLLVRMANDATAPAWTPGDEFEKAR